MPISQFAYILFVSSSASLMHGKISHLDTIRILSCASVISCSQRFPGAASHQVSSTCKKVVKALVGTQLILSLVVMRVTQKWCGNCLPGVAALQVLHTHIGQHICFSDSALQLLVCELACSVASSHTLIHVCRFFHVCTSLHLATYSIQ